MSSVFVLQIESKNAFMAKSKCSDSNNDFSLIFQEDQVPQCPQPVSTVWTMWPHHEELGYGHVSKLVQDLIWNKFKTCNRTKRNSCRTL